MHITTDRAFVPAGAPAVRYLHVLISAPGQRKAADAPRPPASVSLVLDRSGSMAGTKIQMARDAVVHAIRLLSPTDHVGVVCYDEEVTTVLDRTHATKEAKQLALDRLSAIDARGSTDLHAGWQRGAALTKGTGTEERGLAKVLLLTDGLANQGVIDRDALIAAARQLRADGILTSTFGVGADFDEDLLSRIAVEGGGHFYFIERPQQIPDFFASELGETLEVVARDAAFEVVFDPGVDAMVLNDLPSQRQNDRVRVKLGSLVADQEMSLIVAVAFNGAQVEGTAPGVTCRVTDRDGVLPSLPMIVTWQAVDAVQDQNQPIDRDVRVAVATLLAGRARRAALAANANGRFDEAQRILRDALNDLRALAPGEPRVIRIIDELHRDELELAEAMSPMARKAKHFVAYQALYSREAGGTARRTKKES